MNQESNTEKPSDDSRKRIPLALRKKKASSEDSKAASDIQPTPTPPQGGSRPPVALSLKSKPVQPEPPADDSPSAETTVSEVEAIPAQKKDTAKAETPATDAEQDTKRRLALRQRAESGVVLPPDTASGLSAGTEDALPAGNVSEVPPQLQTAAPKAPEGPATDSVQAPPEAQFPPAGKDPTLADARGKPSGTQCGHPVRSALLIIFALLLVVGAVAYLGYLLFREPIIAYFNDAPATTAESPVIAETNNTTAQGTGPISRTRALTREVSDKASVMEILQPADSVAVEAPPAPGLTPQAPDAGPGIPDSTQPALPAIRDIPPQNTDAISPPTTDKPQNPEVRRYIEGIRPTGIRGNRMMLDGQLFETGEVVNRHLGVRWIHWDPQLGVLTFEDERGVRYEKDI